jgi:hypothetical protein
VASSGDDFGWREWISVRVADRRILHAALAAGTSASRSVEERTSGLSTVVSLLQPGRGFTTTLWYRPRDARLDVVGDVDVVPGEQPITAADRAAVVRALRAMASSDRDPQARIVAQRLTALLQ